MADEALPDVPKEMRWIAEVIGIRESSLVFSAGDESCNDPALAIYFRELHSQKDSIIVIDWQSLAFLAKRLPDIVAKLRSEHDLVSGKIKRLQLKNSVNNEGGIVGT